LRRTKVAGEHAGGVDELGIGRVRPRGRERRRETGCASDDVDEDAGRRPSSVETVE
jgi:hypothetical protein